MSLGNPVIALIGRVRRFDVETIPALSARPEQPATETTRFVPARAGRDAYDLATVTVDTGYDGFTDEAGPATIVYRISTGDHAGVKFDVGQDFAATCRPFQAWMSIRGRNVQVIRFGLVKVYDSVDDLVADRPSARRTGPRPVAASA